MRGSAVIRGCIAAALALGALSLGAPAAADQAACRNLEAQLASVTRGSDRTKLRRYERAIISQKQQLERATNQRANTGCATLLSAIKPQCGPIRATVSKMERNLLALQRTKNELAGGSAPQEKARILAALDANGCRDGTARTASDGNEKTGLFGRLYREAPAQAGKQAGSEKPAPGVRSSAPHSAAPGRYRTLCVRTCDGYFFPIAYSSSPRLFQRDSKVCEAMCPGTEVELYYHKVPDEETDAMISAASGMPYTELPAAFRYRQSGYERPKACGCNAPKDFSIIAGELPDQSEEDEAPRQPAEYVPEPASRPDPAEDGETRANREGGLTAAAMAELLAPKVAVKSPALPAETPGEHERRVRVVGPAFLPDPEAAIDLRAPDRTQIR